MDLAKKLILVDADGVLLDWFYTFAAWMNQHGHSIVKNDSYCLTETFDIPKPVMKEYVRYFNESARIEYLPPFRDAVKYVRKLHEDHGFVFHCITSLSTDSYAAELRRKNIHRLFGKSAFERITCLETNAAKDEALAEYKDSGCFWIEDKAENAIAGLNAGLTPILMEHGHNETFQHEQILKVQSWRQIYEHVT